MKESLEGKKMEKASGSTKPDDDRVHLDEASASGMIHWLTATAIIEVRYESGLVISLSKPTAGVRGGGGKEKKKKKLVGRKKKSPQIICQRWETYRCYDLMNLSVFQTTSSELASLLGSENHVWAWAATRCVDNTRGHKRWRGRCI